MLAANSQAGGFHKTSSGQRARWEISVCGSDKQKTRLMANRRENLRGEDRTGGANGSSSLNSSGERGGLKSSQGSAKFQDSTGGVRYEACLTMLFCKAGDMSF